MIRDVIGLGMATCLLVLFHSLTERLQARFQPSPYSLAPSEVSEALEGIQENL